MDNGDTGGPRAYCLFPFRARSLAVGVDAVEALVEADRLVRLPLCPGPVSGLCTYRGGLLPIIQPADDPEGWDEGPGARRPAVLVLRTGRGLLGLLIGRGDITVVEDCRADDVGDLTVVEGGESLLPEGLVAAGSIVRDGTSYPLIEPHRTWTAVRELIARGYHDGRGPGAPAAGGVGVGGDPTWSEEGGAP